MSTIRSKEGVHDKTVLIYLASGGNNVEVGFVKIHEGATYAELQQEIEIDELQLLQDRRWVFLGDRGLQLSPKQEHKFIFDVDEVHVKFVDCQMEKNVKLTIDEPPVLHQPESRKSDIIEVKDERDGDGVEEINEVGDATSAHVNVESRLQSKMARKAHVTKWQRDLTQKMTDSYWNHGRKDRCEIMFADVNGQAKFYVWCIECDMQYERGNHDTIYNFVKHHCKTRSHVENYERKHQSIDMTICSESIGADYPREKNKAEVDLCPSLEVAKFIEETGVPFELYEATVNGYANLRVCLKTLALFPRAGDLGFNMKEHIKSARHVRSAMALEEKTKRKEENHVGGRPRKDAADPKQQSLFSFIAGTKTNSDPKHEFFYNHLEADNHLQEQNLLFIKMLALQ